MLYVESSAFAKRYLDGEPERDACLELMDHDDWATSRITYVETASAISRSALDGHSPEFALSDFNQEFNESVLVDVDFSVLRMARAVVLSTGIKALDAIHIASAQLLQAPSLQFLTFDRKQARAAAASGLTLAIPLE